MQINKTEINLELRKFKDDRGAIKFNELFELPQDHRVYKWAETNIEQTIGMVAVALTLAMESINVSRRMNDNQISDLAEIIVEECVLSKSSEGISFEDIMLFLQKLTRGEYHELYEGIDQSKFMARFNLYRDERWNAWIEARDKKHEEFKRLGDDNSFDRRNPKPETPFDEYLQSYNQRIQQKNDEIERLRAENKRQQQ